MITERIELITQSVHASLKAFCILKGYQYAIPRWQYLSDHDQRFAIEITKEILERLEIENLTAAQVHEIWLKKRLQEGYKLGLRRDRKMKFHPNMMPWDQLRDLEKQKSKIVLNTIKLLGMIE